jgi:bifunctional non-homologous end joining protein LigD
MARSTAAAKLAKYRARRDFERTPEPSASTARPGAGRSFVVQQHAARRMHYDFRLEHEGVMWSWSVPRGPSLSPSDRRLAVRTEDHPLDYAGFEGVIPPGQYGSGAVVVWDRGTWEPEGDAGDAMKRGRLTFVLHGEKLRGRWHLVRTRGTDKQERWLLFKARDEAASEGADVLAARPASVLSGRTIDEVAASPARTWQLGFALTNLDKVLYPEQGITKGELMAYLAVVAEHMLPHVAGRPLTLVRCPDGRTKCFFQKHVLPGAPEAIRRVELEEAGGQTATYMAIDDLPGLVALAQLGTLEIHTWGARADRPERPDLMVFDLDPDVGLPWDRVAAAALELRRRLSELGLESFVKTTGGKGLHVAAPIERRTGWDELKAFAKAVVARMEGDEPGRYTTNMGKAHRRGKVFLDYLRNGRGATFVAPYSPRARPGAPVAVPISWEELARGVDPAAFTTRTVPPRLGKLGADPWRRLGEVRQSITAAAWRAVGGKPRARPTARARARS